MPIVFHDVPPEAFPMIIEFRDQAGSVVHRMVVEGPGPLHIPGLAEEHGPVSARVILGDGTILEGGGPDE